MDNKLRRIMAGVFILSFVLIGSHPVLADEITVTGIINDTYQIVANDGTVYEIADTDMGDDLLNHVGMTVEVSGSVVVEEGVKVINVKSYKVLEKTES